MDTLGKRIKYLREGKGKGKGCNQEELARKLGMTSAVSISKYESDQRQPSISKLIKLSDLFNVDIGWLVSGKESGLPPKQDIQTALEMYLDPKDEKNIIMVHEHKSAGVSDNKNVSKMAFTKDWLEKEMGLELDKLSIINIVGDSMKPLLINGDTVLIDQRIETQKTDGIYAIDYDEALKVKRLQFTPQEIVVISDNSAYERIAIPRSEESPLKIIGRIVWLGKKI